MMQEIKDISSMQNIFLIGPMGVGKSTIGKKLAQRLGLDFYDADLELEKVYKLPISAILNTNGEETFRSYEKAILADFIKSTNSVNLANSVVLATGGGVVLDADNRSLLQASGIVIYLKAKADNLCSRISEQSALAANLRRPSLNLSDPGAMLHRLKCIVEDREKLYQSIADHTLDTNDLNVEETVDRIMQVLPQYSLININNSIYFSETLADLYKIFEDFVNVSQAVFIIDENVANSYLPEIKQQLETKSNITQKISYITINGQEENKNWETVSFVLTQLTKLKLDRKSVLIACGGGVVGDITGFVAAIFMRGITWYNIPTTLLAQVDSAIGGKTGINFANTKNLIGCFHQPKKVLISISFLKTLPYREYISGIAEIIKYAIAFDAEFLKYLEANVNAIKEQSKAVLLYIIRQSCCYKYDIIVQDEKELGIRALLNLGHTFAHALEAITAFSTYLHGEAVAIGLYLVVKLSWRLNLLPESDFIRIKTLIKSVGLPTEAYDFDLQEFISIIYRDKKHVNSNLNFVLLNGIGKAFICNDINLNILENFLYETYKTVIQT